MTKYAEGEQTRFSAAMLRVVLALKRDPEAQLDTIIDEVAQATGVERERFRTFIAKNADVMIRVVNTR